MRGTHTRDDVVVKSWDDDDVHPTVTVMLPEEEGEICYRVDLVKSVMLNSGSFEHNLIRRARQRFVEAISRGPIRNRHIPNAQVGRNCLDRLHNALKEGAEKRREYVQFVTRLEEANWTEAVAVKLAPILREARIQKGTSHKKLGFIKEQIEKTFGEYDEKGELVGMWMYHIRIENLMEYLEEVFSLNHANVRLPTRIRPDSLKNAYLGWLWQMEPRSVSDRLSSYRRMLDEAEASAELREYLPPWYTQENYEESSPHALTGLVYQKVESR
jgi:hypothetical protein